MNELLTAALEYAERGIPVVPLHTPTEPDGGCSCNRRTCDSVGKHPRLLHGLRDATIAEDQIHSWWRMWPAANIGLVTGTEMDVCDIDSEEGLAALLELVGDQALTGPSVATGSGGWHTWVRPTGLGNRVGLLPGVDWRGRGGYVVAPPSLHASGQRYRWNRPLETPLPVCPPALRQQVEGPSAQLVLGEPAQLREPTRYAQAALEGELAKVRAAQPGNRNHTLNRAAFALGQFVGANLLDRRTVERELTAAGRDVGLGPVEAARTTHSGLTAGARNPRQAIPAATDHEVNAAAQVAGSYPHRGKSVPARRSPTANRAATTARIPRQALEKG